MSIGVCYPDKYAVEETFQLFKIPWEWYVSGNTYDVVIARKNDVPEYSGNLININENDIFKQISDLLNKGQMHLHEPLCDILIDWLRQELKKYTILVEIPPVPWGYRYTVALTHDVDVTSVRECRLTTVGFAALQCFKKGDFSSGFNLLCAKCGIGKDPWALFEFWERLEDKLGVRSTFFFVPKKNDPGVNGHPYRAVCYEPKEEILQRLAHRGWEIGVHGIDNWIDSEKGKEELNAIESDAIGNRTHWLLFDQNSWKKLDDAGYSYDTTFGYNDDVGFRAGTLQVYRPRNVERLLELPLHIQDLGLFGKFCRAPTDQGWKKTDCLNIGEQEALEYCNRIFVFARKFGGVITILWHYENLTPPRDWSRIYTELVRNAKTDKAWVINAKNIVSWFRCRRAFKINFIKDKKDLFISLSNPFSVRNHPSYCLRVYLDPSQIDSVNGEFVKGKNYIDVKISSESVVVHLK